MSNSDIRPLNLPPANLKLVRKGNRLHVLDVIRRKEIVLTPEEWVRQHVVHWLIGPEWNISRNRIGIEVGFELNGLSKRCDIIVFQENMKPWMLVECKRPDVPLSDEVLFQAQRYNMVWDVPKLLITNGLEHKLVDVGR